MWLTPSAPDLTRPLRNAPVQRAEVLVHPSDWRLLTMPLGTYTAEEDALVGAPGLWAAVLAEIAAEHAAAADRRRQFYEQALSNGWRPAQWMTEALPFNIEPRFSEWWVREYVCEQCGARHLGGTYYRGWSFRHRVCSNHCEAERRAALKRQWQRDHPAPSALAHAARTEKRAAAREGRQCAQCGEPITAARSTRRFCSDRCRVKAHRR